MPTIWEWPKEWRGTTSSQFQLLSKSLTSASPFTGQRTVYGPQVQKFVANLTFPTMRPEKHRRVQGFITRLDGVVGLVRMVDYHRMKTAYDQFEVNPVEQDWSDGSGWSDGTKWVDGYLPPFIEVDEAAPEGSESIVVRNLPASLIKPIGWGDLFEARPNGIPAPHAHLYENVADVNTNASGKTRLYFKPGLRKGVAAGDMIVIRYPTSVFKLATDNEGAITRGLVSLAEMGLSLEEQLPWQ